MEHFVSVSCGGEICGMCYRERKQTVPATHKVGEELPDDYPTMRHNATQYVCCDHFASIMGAETALMWAGCPIDLRKVI